MSPDPDLPTTYGGPTALCHHYTYLYAASRETALRLFASAGVSAQSRALHSGRCWISLLLRRASTLACLRRSQVCEQHALSSCYLRTLRLRYRCLLSNGSCRARIASYRKAAKALLLCDILICTVSSVIRCCMMHNGWRAIQIGAVTLLVSRPTQTDGAIERR